MSCSAVELRQKTEHLLAVWLGYESAPRFENFVEFAITLNSYTEFLLDKAVPGISNQAREIEQQALLSFGDDTSHPLADEVQQELQKGLADLRASVESLIDQSSQSRQERRQEVATPAEMQPGRTVLLMSDTPQHWADLLNQLGYFGIPADLQTWDRLAAVTTNAPVVLLDVGQFENPVWMTRVKAARARFGLSQIMCLSMPSDFNVLQRALSSGCDHCIPIDTALQTIVSRILEITNPQDGERFRVLIVDDSLTATKLIERSLQEQSIETFAINKPQQVLQALRDFQPDLILLDMYMPDCTGVEAARVIRQHGQFLSIPIVYLSGETDVALQIDALRLGGDHFLTKPFNPVFLNAIVKSKIERYRALRRSMLHDSLTGLLNHTSTKSGLDAAMEMCRRQQQPFSVAMVDIDHFKKVNDTYGHPVGDQIIRSLAWMLKQRLRRSDVVGRYGGEEFVVGLPGADRQTALTVLDRIREDFSRIRHPFESGYFNITFSCGLASTPLAPAADSLLKLADDALYQAKRGGRNQIVAAV